MKGAVWPSDDHHQSVADTDFVGNANTYAMVENLKKRDDKLYWRNNGWRLLLELEGTKQRFHTSFYLGIDVSGDPIADLL
jgi:hypothetical protein